MESYKKIKNKITPQEAKKILNDEGMNVTLDEATQILKFLQDIANVAVRKFLNEKEENKETSSKCF